MTEGIIHQPGLDLFRILRTCPSCFRLFVLEPVENADKSQLQVFSPRARTRVD